MTAEYNYFYRAELTLVGYFGGSLETRTYDFVNKPLSASMSVADYWPILKTVGEYSVSVGEYLPTSSISSITLDNARGSFGPNRKFSDVLQRYSPIEQSIVIYVAQEVNNTDTVTSWDEIASGSVKTWTASSNGEPELTFNISPVQLSEKVLTLEVARTVSGMENAPDSSLGRVVPLVLTTNEVSPIRISADGATTTTFAWATCFYEHLQMYEAVPRVFTKLYNGEWAYMLGGTTDYTGGVTSTTYTLNTYDARAFEVFPGNKAIVTGVQLRARANNLGARTSVAKLSVFLLRVDGETLAVLEEAARGRVDLSAYDTLNNNSAVNTNFAINVSFDRPVVLNNDASEERYFLGWEVTGYAANELSLHYDNALSWNELRKDGADTAATTNNAYTEWKLVTGQRPLCYKFHEVTTTANYHVDAYTQTGLTYASATMTQFTPDTGQSNPPLDNMPFVFSPYGVLIDYGAHPTSLLVEDIVNKLGYEWDGGVWVDASVWDTSTYTSTYASLYRSTNHRARGVTGVLDQRTTYTQFLTEFCKGTASKVGISSSGQMYLFPWGGAIAASAVIPAEDIIPLLWEQRDVSSVINRAVLKMGRSYTGGARDAEASVDSGYQYSEDYSASNYTQVAATTAESRTLYGDRDLSQNIFPLFGGSYQYLGGNAGSVLADYYFAVFGKPPVYCSFIVPWHRYSTLQLFNVVSFQHPEFPAFFGTDPEPPMPYVDDGSTVTAVEPNAGYEWVRAEPYRGLIEGISYVMAMEHAPAIRLTVRVLLNHPYDPT